MYNGTNPIALNSRNWLKEALLSLMEEKPYDKITIKDICTRADLSRQTFYNFFETKNDILRFCIQQCYTEMMESLKTKHPLTLPDITKSLSDTFQNHHRLIRLIICQNLDGLLEHELAVFIRIFAEQMNPEDDSKLTNYGTAFLAGAITHTVIYWFKDPQPLSSGQLADLLADIIRGNYYTIPGV